MSALIKNKKPTNITSKLINMTPYKVYLDQIRGIMDNIRYTRKGMDYTPPQLGGLSGQRDVVTEKVVLQVIDFEAENGN